MAYYYKEEFIAYTYVQAYQRSNQAHIKWHREAENTLSKNFYNGQTSNNNFFNQYSFRCITHCLCL